MAPSPRIPAALRFQRVELSCMSSRSEAPGSRYFSTAAQFSTTVTGGTVSRPGVVSTRKRWPSGAVDRGCAR